jgi:hypothetical protein
MIGGDWRTTLDGHVGTNSLIPHEERISFFDRVAFDVSDALKIYGQASYNRYRGQSFYQQTPSTNVTIRSDNAYLQTQYPTVAAATASPRSRSGRRTSAFRCRAATTRAKSIVTC